MVKVFDDFSTALRSAVDFCRSPDVGILSGTLLEPIATLFPIVYFLYHQRNGSVPEADRLSLRSFLYFLLFNGFVKSGARIRYLRSELSRHISNRLPLDSLLRVIKDRQKYTFTNTTPDMLNAHPSLALNVAQPQVCRETLSWQERPEVDHIFPQSIFRPRFPELVDDIGNLAYLGKLRNIRKSDEMPSIFFAGVSDEDLWDQFLIENRTLLVENRFVDFVTTRRQQIVERVKAFLGR
jgi:hypothetical protein